MKNKLRLLPSLLIALSLLVSCSSNNKTTNVNNDKTGKDLASIQNLKTITFGLDYNHFPVELGEYTCVNNLGEEIPYELKKIGNDTNITYNNDFFNITSTYGEKGIYLLRIYVDNVYKVSCKIQGDADDGLAGFNGEKDGKYYFYSLLAKEDYIDPNFETNLRNVSIECSAVGDSNYYNLVITYKD